MSLSDWSRRSMNSWNSFAFGRPSAAVRSFGVAIEAQLSCDSLGVKERAEVYVSSSSDASSPDVCMVTELLGVGG